MSENNNNNENNSSEEEKKETGSGDEFSKQFSSFIDSAVKSAQDLGKKAADRLDKEKQKAEVRSEIGHNSRELSKAYEKLGRAYYEFKENNTVISEEKDTFDLIRSKEKLIELLNEKLDSLEK